VAAYLSRVWEPLQNGPQKLTHKQAVSLAGEAYRRFTEALEENPGSPETWREVRAVNALARAGKFGGARS
jgi:hypothetical protein